VEPQPQQTAAPPPPRWGVGDFLMGLVAGLALSTLFASAWLAITGDKDLDLTGQALSQVGLWTGMLGSVFLASHRKGTGSLAEDFGFKARWSDIGLGAMVAVVVQLIVLPGLGYLLRPLLGQPEVSGPVRDLMDETKGPAFIILVLSVSVGAPLVEELFFRGLLLRSLQRRLPDGWAVALAAVAFGLAHGSALPADAVILVIVSLTVFGAALAMLALRTGRLGPGIVAHALFNLLTILYLAATR
jgi:membrane protease YdiL (CAAX protease family)